MLPCVNRGIWFVLSLVIISLLTASLSAQDIDMDAVRAREELRWGVSAYHLGLFAEAVTALERALSYDPDDQLIVEWLGFAYYRLGYEETALLLWDSVSRLGASSATLDYLIDTLEYRRGVNRELANPSRYVETFELRGSNDDFELFLRPSSVLPSRDGGYYVSSFASNQVIRFNANSALDRRILGGLAGLDHPFDIVETGDGHLLISEFLGHQIYRTDLQGFAGTRIGEKGTLEGQLFGPQYLAIDGHGYFYVSESGNRRVSKFDYDGNFILSFGPFLNPTGVVVHRDRVFVSDQRGGYVSIFDGSGNFLANVGEGFLTAPEGLSVYDDGVLLIADTTSLKLLDIEEESVTLLSDELATATKLTMAVSDVNGNILVTDFGANTLSIYTDITSLYTGLLVEVASIDATEFPRIVAEVRVQSRDGAPITGLDESNFILTERSGTVDSKILRVDSTRSARIAVVLEDSTRIDHGSQIIESSLGELIAGLGPFGGVSLYRAGPIPVVVGADTTEWALVRELLTVEATGTDWRVDSALKLAAAELVTFPGQRAIVVITSGQLGSDAFAEYPPDVLASYFHNNGIVLYCVYLDAERRSDALEYLSQESGGVSLGMYQPRGIGEVAADVLARSTGRYFFEYQSESQSNFGSAYIPVEAEVFFYRRTGRGASAYFPPLEF